MNLEVVQERLQALRDKLDSSYDMGVLIRSFLKFAPVSMVMLDRESKIILWTKQFENMAPSKECGDLSGVHISVVLPKLYEEPNIKKCITCVESGAGTVWTGEGEALEYEINHWPLNGHMGGSILFFKDVGRREKFILALRGAPERVSCKDKTRCMWNTEYGDVLRDLAKEAFERSSV